MNVAVRSHSVRSESHIQCNTIGEVGTAASKRRGSLTTSVDYCLFVPHIYIWVLLFAHILLVVNRTFNTTPNERLENLQQDWARLLEITESEKD